MGAPFRFEWLLTHPLWHVDAVKGGRVHPIAYRSMPTLNAERVDQLRPIPPTGESLANVKSMSPRFLRLLPAHSESGLTSSAGLTPRR